MQPDGQSPSLAAGINSKKVLPQKKTLREEKSPSGIVRKYWVKGRASASRKIMRALQECVTYVPAAAQSVGKYVLPKMCCVCPICTSIAYIF